MLQPEASWAESIEASPLAAISPIGVVVVASNVAVEFHSIELRQNGGFVYLRVQDTLSRDDGQGPLNVGMPFVTIIGLEAGAEVDAVMAEYMDANRVRYRIAFRPCPPVGSSVQVRIDGFESGMLASERGPWLSPPVVVQGG